MKIERMDKKIARVVADAVVKALSSTILEQFGLTVTAGGGTLTDDSFTMKVEMKLPIKEVVGSADTDTLKYGLAKRGTVAYFRGEEVVIEKARREKYEYYYKKDPTKHFIARFEYFKLAPSIATPMPTTPSKPSVVGKICQGEPYDTASGHSKPCTKLALKVRKWRRVIGGDQWMVFCDDCCQNFDEAQAEAKAEARAS